MVQRAALWRGILAIALVAWGAGAVSGAAYESVSMSQLAESSTPSAEPLESTTPDPSPSEDDTSTPDPSPSETAPDDGDPTETPVPEETEDPGVDTEETEEAPTSVLPGLPPGFAPSEVSIPMVVIALVVLIGSVLLLWALVRRPPAPAVATALPRTGDDDDPAEVVNSLIVVGTAMIDCGYPVGLVREALEDIGAANGLPATEAVIFPTAIVVSADRSGKAFTRASSAGTTAYLLHEMDTVDSVVRAARTGSRSAKTAREAISQLVDAPDPFSRLTRFAAYVLVSASISVLLGASWLGVLIAAILGAGVGLLLLLAERLDADYAALVTVAAAFGVSLVVFLLAGSTLDPGVLPSLVAPLVLLLPGGLLTTGVIELATGNIMAGSARVAAGAMRLLLLAVGIVAAAALVGIPQIELDAAAEPLGAVAPWIAVAFFGVGIAVNQCAHPQSIGWILLVLYVAYGAQVLADVFLGGVLSALIGAVAMTPVAVIVGRQRTGPPAIVSFLPAFWLLVPGALGLVGVTAVLDGDAAGLSTITTTIATMIAIALGVLIGLALTRPLRVRALSESGGEPTVGVQELT